MEVNEKMTETEGIPVILTSWRLVIVIGSLCLGIFLFGLDTNIIGTAIPRITTEFHSLANVSWYGSSYLLAVTVIQPLFGNFYKFFNVKIVYMISLLVFEVGSAICAAANSSGVLILGRTILGLGAAGLLQGALATISNVVRLDQVPMFQGIVVSALGVSVCVGPVLGGVLTEYASWRWCFLINIPMGVFVIIVVLLFVPLKQQSGLRARSTHVSSKLQHMDIGGMILFSGSICCLLLVVTFGGTSWPWNTSRCIGLFVGFGSLWIVFSIWLWKRGDTALIPLRVLRQRSIWTGALVLFGIGMTSQTYAYYLPIFFQAGQGVSVTQSGVRFIALVIPEIVAIGVIGGVVSAWGYYFPYLLAGLTVASIGAGLFTTVAISTPTAVWATFMVITGIGIGIVQQVPYTAVQAVLDTEDVPTGNAIAVFSGQLGGAVALAIAENLLISRLNTSVPQYTKAVSAAEVITAGVSGLSSLTSSPEILEDLRRAYTESVRYTFILAVAGLIFAFLFACCMERVNIKNVAEARQSQEEEEGAKASAAVISEYPVATQKQE